MDRQIGRGEASSGPSIAQSITTPKRGYETNEQRGAGEHTSIGSLVVITLVGDADADYREQQTTKSPQTGSLVVRRRSWRVVDLENDFVQVAIPPVFVRLIGPDQRVFRSMGMGGGMFAR